MFDVPHKTEIVTEWNAHLPIEERSWHIGLIVGPSGSGKTTIATEVFKDAYFHQAYEWSPTASLVDGFPSSVTTKQVVEMLSSVGLASPPHWLKPFQHLSNGQKFRAELARVLLSDHPRVIFDEFTSVVDRDVARICSAALAKTIRMRQRPQLVAISCHFDILDWLQPDWVFDVASGRFEWRSLQRRPTISLEIFEADHRSWKMFRGYHYIDANLNHSARCFVAMWEGKPVGFCSFLHFPHPKTKNIKREHRTVVLPDFQGVGIGNKLSEFVANRCRADGFRFMSTSSSPSMIAHRNRSPLWKCNRFGHAAPSVGSNTLKAKSAGRVTACFEYIGDTHQRVSP